MERQASLGQRPQNFHIKSLGLLILLPVLIFVLISFLMVFVSHTAQVVIWIVVAFCFFISFVFMITRKVHTRDGPNFWVNVGGLCALATIASTGAGIFNCRTNISHFWAYKGQRSYTNVLPSEPALSHLDGGTFIFSEDARVETTSFGFLHTGRYFCVAPIVGSAQQATVEYWAAGLDCCNERNFSCHLSASTSAHAGIVYLDDEQFVRHEISNFRRAAKSAADHAGVSGSSDALFVKWVEDPEQTMRAFWNRGVRFLVSSILVHVGFSMVAGTALHCCRWVPLKSKVEDRYNP
mmetsp:Transcript_87644/g.203889  ORF Transcript_87644/g.203889 Transcript_87644/m.203889 type:complete len:294 (-) Transcript_87644:78-959(-)